MGKTAEGAVWLNQEQRSPYEYWQYWRNTEDADVGRFLRLFTELPLDEIARLEKLGGAEINDAKKTLATAATALCHGQALADEAAATARSTFEQHGASLGLPTVTVPRAELEAGIPLYALVHKAGLADSNSAARKLVQGNGVKLNDATVADEKRTITLEDVNTDGAIKLSAGKKRHVLVKPG
jgi:tyrosyl-tRNA synthetase